MARLADGLGLRQELLLDAKLEAGMVISNEPGYYKTGAYGIRIENLVLVIHAPPPADAEKKLLAFETLTRAPIDRRPMPRRWARRLVPP